MSARLGQQPVGQMEFLALRQLGELHREFGRHFRQIDDKADDFKPRFPLRRSRFVPPVDIPFARFSLEVMTRFLGAILIMGVMVLNSFAAEPFTPAGPMIKLWPGVAPGSEGKTAPERWIDGATPDAFHRVTDIHAPSLTIYLPPKDRANGTAIIIAPGGGHRYLVVDLEGELVAQKLNAMGVAAFVLRSRLAKAEGSTYRVEVESLADIQQAIRVVRARAGEWNLNPARVGVMGFSAGGELAALAENHLDTATRPDFAVLGYPGFITGGLPPVSPKAPPTFLFVNDDDPFATGTGEYYLALRAAKVSAEFHAFRRGGHGTGATGRGLGSGYEKLGAAKWPELLGIWLGDLGLLTKVQM
jgi:acetyl esterase/lipase